MSAATLRPSGYRGLTPGAREALDAWLERELPDLHERGIVELTLVHPSRLVLVTAYLLRDGKRYVGNDGTPAKSTHLRYPRTPFPIAAVTLSG